MTWPARYGMALAVTAGVVLLGMAVGRALDAPVPLALLTVAAIFSSWYGGLGPGLFATLLSGLVGSFFFLEPPWSIEVHQPDDWLRIGALLVTGGVVSWLNEALHGARRQALDEARTATERQEALHESQERLGIALSAARLGSWHLDLRTFELTCSDNFKANFGRAPDEPFTYEMVFEAMHPEDREKVRAGVQEAVQERQGYRSEYRVFWPDGSLHWITSRGRVTSGDDGHSVSMDGVTLDITERRLLEESLRQQAAALQEADRRKDEFLAMLAHELRNPLAPIRNTLQILALRRDDPEMVDQARELMERQVQQMVRLVDDLLDVSRISRGKLTLRKAPLDLGAVITTAVETSRPLIETRRHELTVRLPEPPVQVEGDAARLAQVLSNLLNNAAKYTEVGGRIDLTAGREDGEAVVRVCDTGIGMAPEMLPQVFDLFAQADSAADRAQGGLGVGLTLVRRLVEMHGGTVEAHSDGLGRGSELVVRLPALADSVTAAPVAVPDQEPARIGAASRRVLIVDDNVDSAESLALLLELFGHDVRLAHDGLAALEQARTTRPDVLLLDIGLPKLDGYEVARRLRGEPELASVLLVAMTGYGQEQDRRRSRDAGFDHHFVKPIDVDRLQALLEQPPGQPPATG